MFGLGRYPDPQDRLERVVELMQSLSRQTDPQAMVNDYGSRMGEYMASQGFMSLSRRNLIYPHYRVTRSSRWAGDIDPWRNPRALPSFSGGLMGELLYSDRPHLILDLPSRLGADDPLVDYLSGYKAMMAVPHYDGGRALNMVVHLYNDPASIDPANFPEVVWMSNLFGRSVSNLVLSRDLRAAYDALDRELQVVGEIQRSLLPSKLPEIAGLKIAAHYQTSRRAGGDYYDFFPLPDGRWGIFIADVSGHGTPAAVVMAITHAIAHTYPGPHLPPGQMLAYLNDKLARSDDEVLAQGAPPGTFVTAFYAVYDPPTRQLRYACAGHPPPRWRKARSPTSDVSCVMELADARSFPLGIVAGEAFDEACVTLSPGDQMLMYTDGFTEAFSPEGEMFMAHRLDEIVCRRVDDPALLIERVIAAVDAFTDYRSPEDDRTLLALVAV